MSNINRRDFFGKAVAAASCLPLLPPGLGWLVKWLGVESTVVGFGGLRVDLGCVESLLCGGCGHEATPRELKLAAATEDAWQCPECGMGKIGPDHFMYMMIIGSDNHPGIAIWSEDLVPSPQ